MRPDPERDRVTRAAESRYPLIADTEVFGCWHVVTEAASKGWLTAAGRLSVARLADVLEGGGSLGVQEYEMTADGDRVLVAFLDESYTCPRAAMIAELRALDGQLRPEAEVPTRGEPPEQLSGEPPPGFDPGDLRRALDALAEAVAERNRAAPEEVARIRRQATEALGDLEDGTAPAEPVRREAAEALRAFADWADQPDGADEADGPGGADGRDDAGARVDAVIQRLEDAAERLLPGRAAAERETLDRITGSAREAIARRLAENEES